MARSTRTVVAAVLLVAAMAVATVSAQHSSSEFDCNQSCVKDCVEKKEEHDCPTACKEVCVVMEKLMARAAADKDCPLQCYESCMIQGNKDGKAGCTSECMKFCKVTNEQEFTARLNPNTI
ncbi:unnamed protein product [Urochloa humidicola]